MASRTTINGLSIAYEIHGEGRPWVITPGGRFSKDYPGVRPMAQALAERGNKVLIYDRPNTGESDVCFDGENESQMQADTLAGLLEALDMAPAMIVGGSGGARVSLLTCLSHRELATALAVWWITGGVNGLMSLAMHYGAGSLRAAWNGGMEAVAELPEWQEVIERNPPNRDKILAQDKDTFIATMERWMHTYCFCSGDSIPGARDADIRELDLPALVFRSGKSDFDHTRAQSENLASLLPNSRLVEPPWPDTEWRDRAAGKWVGFERWPLLVPPLSEWADEILG
jgi:pimeloyl-ACP methyl ester carboxylesterase